MPFIVWGASSARLGFAGGGGVVSAGAFADLLVVDGDPSKDISLLTSQGERIAGVMKNGLWVRQTLS